MNNINSCIVYSDFRSQPSVKEQGKSYTIVNTKKDKITCVKIDDCVFETEQKKCDFLFLVERDVPIAFFVELKGCNVSHGIEQLHSSIKALKNDFANHQLEARISNIGNTIPDLKNRKTYIDLAKIVYPTKGSILVKKSPFIETI